jgi:hypothetical protein
VDGSQDRCGTGGDLLLTDRLHGRPIIEAICVAVGAGAAWRVCVWHGAGDAAVLVGEP